MKKTVTFTVEEEVVDMFNQVAENKSLNKSKWIENQMVKLVKEEVE